MSICARPARPAEPACGRSSRVGLQRLQARPTAGRATRSRPSSRASARLECSATRRWSSCARPTTMRDARAASSRLADAEQHAGVAGPAQLVELDQPGVRGRAAPPRSPDRAGLDLLGWSASICRPTARRLGVQPAGPPRAAGRARPRACGGRRAASAPGWPARRLRAAARRSARRRARRRPRRHGWLLRGTAGGHAAGQQARTRAARTAAASLTRTAA